jgi:hypothetical protein
VTQDGLLIVEAIALAVLSEQNRTAAWAGRN